MTPERLVLDEFGPYTETQTVDFEALSAQQLFLIHGPTGSGKSSLLDAICFALYGETSGNERGGGEMRSDFASLDEPTEVTLDFRLGEERYRLRRRPKQTLAKKRGDGTTDKSQKATLYDRSEANSRPEDGRPIADGMRDVNGTVKELLGLESEQFRQVVVLPQGKFRQFLSAGSTEREDILKVLFETGRYERLEEIEDLREELESADERYENVGFLSDVARGKNRQRMSLQRFVLATRLEEVLQVANDHIEHMTQNRYHLLRAEEVRGRRSGAGLDLLVYDAQTGERRPVSTLSGGEGFMTSLSLALGLSDVVQSVSGGRHLETLFIDEGFGSLDQEALNRAMEALSDLRDTGRLVGVISHVSELKQRIPTRLEVEQTQQGSTLSMTV